MPLRSTNLLPLVGGAYTARSTIANFQICENLFPEINPEESQPDVPVTHYPREGKLLKGSPPAPGPGRGVFTLSNGALYSIVGSSIYRVTPDWAHKKVGDLTNLSTPVSMSDNGANAVIVDGTSKGYVVKMSDDTFTQLIDPTGTFIGSRKVDFSDTFLAFSPPGTNDWMVSLSNQVAFNAFAQASKDSKPDPIQTFGFNLRQMWLFGTESAEVWYLAGSTPFPYQEQPNIFIPYGCAAPYSLTQADVSLFWISQNQQGQAIALQSTSAYNAVAISTRALENEWSKYPTVADVIGGSFQQGGHTFVVFHFPTADKTWAYDLATKQWHRRTYIDRNGVAHRESVSFYASVGASGGFPATIVGQDWSNGSLYALDPETYTDNGMPIVFRRTFPHVMKDMHEITDTAFVADFETGDIPGTGHVISTGSAWSTAFSSAFRAPDGTWEQGRPALFMRWSSDGGNSWGNYRAKNRVETGEYRSMMRWRGLGMARDRVYELMWAYPGPSALQGAYIEQIEHGA